MSLGRWHFSLSLTLKWLSLENCKNLIYLFKNDIYTPPLSLVSLGRWHLNLLLTLKQLSLENCKNVIYKDFYFYVKTLFIIDFFCNTMICLRYLQFIFSSALLQYVHYGNPLGIKLSPKNENDSCAWSLFYTLKTRKIIVHKLQCWPVLNVVYSFEQLFGTIRKLKKHWDWCYL